MQLKQSYPSTIIYPNIVLADKLLEGTYKILAQQNLILGQ